MGFSDRLKELRAESGEKQAYIAEIIGVSVQSYSSYETGREPKYDVLCKLARHFDCTTDYLLGLSSTRKPLIIEDVSELGLTPRSLLSLKNGIPTFQRSTPVQLSSDSRTILDVLNCMLEECTTLCLLLETIRCATARVGTAIAAWGNETFEELLEKRLDSDQQLRNSYITLAHEFLDKAINYVQAVNDSNNGTI